jgi:hypothetical protein
LVRFTLSCGNTWRGSESDNRETLTATAAIATL